MTSEVHDFEPEDVAHRLGIDGEITGVEWDPSSSKIRIAARARADRPISRAIGRFPPDDSK